jgi:flagellar motor switch protein FliN/FliY
MSTSGTQPTQEPSHLGNDSKKVELLLDVNLALALRFGERDLTLREILDLNTGSVIELDRAVEEPAELLLGGKVIARGQVVTVDGNYGIRITEMSAGN